MRLIHTRQKQVLTQQDELPPIVMRRVIKENEASRSLIVTFDHNKTFVVMKDLSKRTVVDLLAKHSDCNQQD